MQWGWLVRTCEGWQWRGCTSSCSAQTCMHAALSAVAGLQLYTAQCKLTTACLHGHVVKTEMQDVHLLQLVNCFCCEGLVAFVPGIAARAAATAALQPMAHRTCTTLCPNTCSASINNETLLQAAQKVLCQQCTHCHLKSRGV